MNDNEQEARELVVTHRVALVSSWLTQGEALTPQIVARRLGITDRRALQMLDQISLVLPVYKDGRQFKHLMEAALPPSVLPSRAKAARKPRPDQ